MGMEKRIALPSGIPPWERVVEALRPETVEMRMIDGELSFPEEVPPEGWRELRVAHGGSMVTIRRGEGEIILVCWGNADAAQLRLAELLAEAYSRATNP